MIDAKEAPSNKVNLGLEETFFLKRHLPISCQKVKKLYRV